MILKPLKAGDVAIKGMVFDMDGTLCLPQTWMFAEMRSAIGLTDKSKDILAFIAEMSEAEQAEAHAKLEQVEKKAMSEMEPQVGLLELMDYLNTINLPKTICTRNLIKPVNHLLSNYMEDHQFEPIITREFKPPKPSPEPLLHIARAWGIEPENLVMVGDSIDDMRSGSAAGFGTVLIKTHANDDVVGLPETDVVVQDLKEIIRLMQDGFEKKR